MTYGYGPPLNPYQEHQDAMERLRARFVPHRFSFAQHFDGFTEHVVAEITDHCEERLRLIAEHERAKKLREKYPALQTAWEHYQIILRMCESEEGGPDEIERLRKGREI